MEKALSIDEVNQLKAHNDGLQTQNKELQEESSRHRIALMKIKSYSPACCHDEDCPANGGVGYDNGCDDEKYSFLIATNALQGDKNDK
ncbi:MAG: hypothetical protein WCG95_00220 [bacterium]